MDKSPKKLSSGSKLNLRIAEVSDLLSIYKIVDEYADCVNINRDLVKNALRDILYFQGVICANVDDKIIGGVGGLCLPCMFNDDMFFTVMFFYISKSYRRYTRDFIKELETCLLATKVTKIVYGVMNTDIGEKQMRFFRMMGYSVLETHMVKSL